MFPLMGYTRYTPVCPYFSGNQEHNKKVVPSSNQTLQFTIDYVPIKQPFKLGLSVAMFDCLRGFLKHELNQVTRGLASSGEKYARIN